MERLAPLFARNVDYRQELTSTVEDCAETRTRLAIAAVAVALAAVFVAMVANVGTGVALGGLGLAAIAGFAWFNEGLRRRCERELVGTAPPESASAV